MSEAGVGSIAHILKTAFKDVFDEKKKREDAVVAREQRKIRDEEERIRKEEEERLKAIAEAEAAAAAAAAAKAPKKDNKKKGKEEKEPEPVVVEAPPPPPEPEPEAPPVDPSTLLENYYSRFEKLNIDDNLKADFSHTMQNIDDDLEKKQSLAKNLSTYLKSRREEAIKEEIYEEDLLKKQGIMVGQHIPSLKSKLHIDKSNLYAFEDYSSNLVIARELVEQNHINNLRRTGNMIISEIAEQKLAERSKRQPVQESNDPHYLAKTHAATTREERISMQFATTFQVMKSQREETMKGRETSQKSGTSVNRRNNTELSAEERDLNEEILKSINHKLNYLRNPRNDPTSCSTKMLTKPAAPKNGNAATSMGTAGNSNVSRNNANEAQQHSNSNQSVITSSSNSTNSMASGRRGPQKGTKRTATIKVNALSESNTNTNNNNNDISNSISNMNINMMNNNANNNPLFISDPSKVEFHGYTPGEVYTKHVAFRNVSAVSRTIRVLPPSGSPVFQMSPLRFPVNSRAGVVAPGMSVTATLTFHPESIADYRDTIVVQSESGSVTVPIIVTRESPELTLPPLIDIGACLVGDAVRVPLTCVNTGGPGVFRIVRRGEYDPNDPSSVFHKEPDPGCLRLAPFTIYPTQWSQGSQESQEINIEFVPLTLDSFQCDVSIVFDNNQVRHLCIRSKSKQIDVTVIQINKVSFDTDDSRVKKDLFFTAANIGTDQSQSLEVVNDTGSPLEYEWVFVDADSKQVTKDAQKRVRDREVGDHHYHVDGTVSPSSPSSPSSPLPSNRSPLKSVRTPLIQGAGGDQDPLLLHTSTSRFPSNSIVDPSGGGFELTPSRGVLPGEGVETFTVSFTPSREDLVRTKAVLVIKGVPFAAMPEKNQKHYLSRLGTEGHGKYVRLRSWLEEIGESFKGDSSSPHRKALGLEKATWDPSRSRLNSLKVVLDMVSSYAASEVDYRKLLMLNNWVRQILRHFSLWRAKELEVDDEDANSGNNNNNNSNSSNNNPNGDSSSGNAGSNPNPNTSGKDGGVITLQMMHWDGTSQMAPVKIFPIKLKLGDWDDIVNRGKGSSKSDANPNSNPSPNQDGSEEAVPQVTEEGPPQTPSEVQGVHEEKDVEVVNEVVEDIPELTPMERSMMSEIWLDPGSTLKLLGNTISYILDEKVKHEAVDYIRRNALTNVVCLSVNVSGEGKPQRIHTLPPRVFVPGDLSIGMPWTTRVTLHNPSQAMAEVRVCPDRMVVVDTRGGGDGLGLGLVPVTGRKGVVNSSIAVLECSPDRALIMPESSVEVSLTLALHRLGHYHLTLPLQSSHAVVDPIQVDVHVVPPRIRFNVPEVDLGLVGVGYEESQVLSFTNEGEVTARYSVTCQLDSPLEQGGTGGDGSVPFVNKGNRRGNGGSDSRQSTHRESLNSGRSTQRSEDSSVGSTTAGVSENSYNIENPWAVVGVSPPAGEVYPQQTCHVTLTCKAGKHPQRVRGTVEVRIYDQSGQVELGHQYLSLRGEVQAPKTIMYPMTFTLGKVYIGMPVKFSFTIENLCNLPTRFKLERPGASGTTGGAESQSFRITFDRNSGPLDAKEKVIVNAEFVSLLPGVIDDVIANKIYGLATPLGFQFKAVSRGVLLEVMKLPGGPSQLPVPLAKDTDTQYPGPDEVPEPRPGVDPMEFGDSTPLYERRVIHFAIRNFSAIPTNFKLSVKRYIVDGDTTTLLQEIIRENDDSVGRRDLVLVPHEDGGNKYHSEAGKNYITGRERRKLDKKYLKSGLGASYLVDPPVGGTLPAWGVQLVTVRAFNDMPGCYDDSLEIEYVDNGSNKKILVPLKMTVAGCPLIIEKNTLGMSVMKSSAHTNPNPNHDQDASNTSPNPNPNENLDGQQLLHMGYGCTNCEPMVREFIVRNNGSQTGKLRWRVRSITAKANGPIKVEIGFDERSQRVRTQLLFWEDVAKDTPFRIEPDRAVIPPYGRQAFKVTFFKTEEVGSIRAMLTGQATYESDPNPNPNPNSNLKRQSSISSVNSIGSNGSISQSENGNFSLQLRVEGDIRHPSVKLDKSTYEAAYCPTVVPETATIRLKADASVLFGDGVRVSNGTNPNATCARELTLTNPMESFLAFSVSMEGPFSIRCNNGPNPNPNHNHNHNPNHGNSNMDSHVNSSSSIVRSSTTSSIPGRVFNLNPHTSATLSVVYNPRREMRESLLTSSLKGNGNGGTDHAPEAQESGRLVLSFATGQVLQVPVRVIIGTPFIVASSPRVQFGTCHVTKSCDGILLLSNPTSTLGQWQVSHIPGGGSTRKATAIRVKGFEPQGVEVDDPSVFAFSPDRGVVQGPTLSVASAMSAPPKDNIRGSDSIVPQRYSQTSWNNSILTVSDTVRYRHDHQHQSHADGYFPMPLAIRFQPKKNVRYSSRFRVTCEFGNAFDVLLQGQGTYEENEHKPTFPIPR